MKVTPSPSRHEAYRTPTGCACSSAWMTFSMAARASATFSSLILARTISTFIDPSPSEGTVVAHTQATNGQPPGGQPGSELFEPPGQEPSLGGRGSQLQRPAVRRPGLGVA